MAMPKKGTRQIEVDEVEYRWLVTEKDSKLRLVVELYNEPGCNMTMDFLKHDALTGEQNSISPGIVKEAILHALDNDWNPEEKGSEVAFGMVDLENV